MSSHKLDPVRRARLVESKTPSHDIQSSTSPELASFDSPIVAHPRSQIPRPANASTDRRRGSSAEASEDEHTVNRPYAKESRSLSNNDTHLSGLPRLASTSSSHLLLRRPSASSATTDPAILLSASPAAQITPKPNKFRLAGDGPRNVLRRKAPFRRQNENLNVASGGTTTVENIRPAATAQRSFTEASPIKQNIEPLSSSARDLFQTMPKDSQVAMASKLPRKKTPKAMEEPPARQIPKELAGLSTVINTHNLPPPPTPHFGTAGSPSTRYSESPGMWSSRGSTPTSLSSYSPGIVRPTKPGHRLRQPSPTLFRQPTISRPLTNDLQAEKENHRILEYLSSSGVSDPRTRDEHAKIVGIGRNSKNPPPPRSPPPRKSSMKFKSPKKDKDEERQHESHRTAEDAELRVFGAGDPIEVIAGQSPTKRSPVAPRRPSRQGTGDLELKPSPVIQSNLTALRTTGHTRRESAEKLSPGERLRVIPVASAGASVESLQSSNSTSRTRTSLQAPNRPTRILTKSPKDTKAPATVSLGKKFGFFSKKSKTDLGGGNSALGERPGRKGPVAGTGHEGYGKYAYRGRKPSIGSNSGTRAHSTSTTRSGTRSIASSKGSGNSRPELEIDDFLLDRLEPVIINGGGMDRTELFRTQSNQSMGNLSVTSASDSSTLNGIPLPGGYPSESLVSKTEPFGKLPRPLRSDSYLPSQVKTSQIATRVKDNSFQAVGQNIGGQDIEDPKSRNPSDCSGEPGFSALPPINTATSSAGEGSKVEPTGKEKKTNKQSKGIKWNFFQRSHAANHKAPPLAPASLQPVQLHAAVAQVPNNRPVAHYALLDADSDSLEEILHRVEESPPSEEGTVLSSALAESDSKKHYKSSILLPSPPALWNEFSGSKPIRPASPKVFFHKKVSEDNAESARSRPSRLTSVGRIPRVVSRRDRDHKPPSQSYSRPFSRNEAPSLTITANTEPDVYYTPSRPVLDIQIDVLPSRRFQSEPDTPKSYSAPAINEGMKFVAGAYASNEFLQFSPRKPSQVSSSTGSEAGSILAAVTAIGSRPDWRPNEDDVWTEYDDLLDSVLLPKNSTSQQGDKPDSEEPLDMVTRASKTLQAELNASNNKSNAPDMSEIPTVVPSSASVRSSDGSVRLRRSRIFSALRPSISPSPQVSYSELIAGYGERNKSSHDLAYHDSPSALSQAEDHLSQLPSSMSIPVPDFESTRRRNTLLFDIAERDRDGAVAQTNLRSASLMTSRWLSFGRVLFSPAHNRIKSTDSECILVVDGLGNDDWSYYCSLTYPNATVYSLSIRPSSSSSAHPEAWQPPENHHLIHHPSIETLFPFPKGFFAVCIVRFPAACSEYGQRNIVTECKRVLRPGGYLEMSVLDLDLVNMGSRTRKTVRMLKERIYVADPDISLKPASDNIQRLLGISGFDNLNRCMVSVPVAGMIVGSSDSSNSNRSASIPTSSASIGNSVGSFLMSGSRLRQESPSDQVEPSLGDLLSDPSPSASNDESIAKMVARVGRWWYTRCYEIPVLSEGAVDSSIWANPRLLRECQKRGTGFRLLIAYAQKPSEKRRTVSV